jgi:hypothetical protein
MAAVGVRSVSGLLILSLGCCAFGRRHLLAACLPGCVALRKRGLLWITADDAT